MRHALIATALLLAGCYETLPVDDAGVRRDAGPPVCEEPSVRVLLQTDYRPGDEVVSIVVEVNDMVVDGRGVTTADDLSTGLEVARACAVRPGTRILVRLRDPAGIELATRQVVIDDPASTPEVLVLISR